MKRTNLIKPLKLLFKYNFTINWPKNAIIIMTMIFHEFRAWKLLPLGTPKNWTRPTPPDPLLDPTFQHQLIALATGSLIGVHQTVPDKPPAQNRRRPLIFVCGQPWMSIDIDGYPWILTDGHGYSMTPRNSARSELIFLFATRRLNFIQFKKCRSESRVDFVSECFGPLK